MNAPPSAQARLLDVAALDATISRQNAVRKNPPHAARVQELVAVRQEQSGELTRLRGLRDDAQTELTRLEGDVAVVDARITRDEGLLAATASTKDAQGLESELASLRRRKTALEDAELELMERVESLEAEVTEQQARVTATNEEGARVSADAKAAVSAATTAVEDATRDRAAIVDDLPADLMADYDRIASRGTIAAASLVRRTCEGCHMVLAETDLRDLRAASADDVVHCPECGAILIRGDGSGL